MRGSAPISLLARDSTSNIRSSARCTLIDKVAFSSANDARASSVADRFRLIRELGSAAVPIWAALDSPPNARARLVLVQRLSRGGPHGDAEIDEWARDARRLSTLEHPNIARVREVVVHQADTLVVSDFLDGVRWSELASQGQPPPLDVALRVLVDVLGGLWAIHNLRDARRQPLRLVHGEVTPQNIIVGLDGISRVIGVHRIRGSTAGPGGASGGYLAPEVLIADDAADARADVFSVGVMLWEALSGRPLFGKMQASAIVTQALSGRVPRATLPENSAWAAPLVDLAARALSGEPENRFASTAAFATELRRIAGVKLAQRTRVEALVRATHGDPIRARREALERGEGAREVSAVEPRVGRFPSVPIDVDFGDDDRTPTPLPETPRLPPPPMTAPGTAPAARPLPAPVQLVRPAPARPPPLPASAMVVPPAPAMPRDLGFTTDEGPIELAEAIGLESAPPSAPPLASTSPDALPGMRRRRRSRTAIGLVVGFAALALPSMLWWFGARSHEEASSRHASPAGASPAHATPAQSQTPVAGPPQATIPRGLPEPPSPDPDPTPPSAAVPAPSAMTSETATPEPPPSPVVGPPFNAARPVAKKKYEPEGI